MKDTTKQVQAPKRINSIDAVRASALLMIIFTHSVIGFWSGASRECLTFADTACEFVRHYITADVGFGMFSFLFGLSFFLQLDHAEARGIDFRGRFCWRLVLLIGFAFLDRLCYRGDILGLFATMGFALVCVWKLKTKHLVILCAVCMLQLVPLLWHFANLPTAEEVFAYPVAPDPQHAKWSTIAKWNTTYGFWDYAITYAATGRYWAVLGFFLLGTLAGRLRIFERGIGAIRKLVIPLALIWCSCSAIAYLIHVDRVFHWWRCSAQVALFVVCLACLYEYPPVAKRISCLRAIGRCTLTGYISQNAFMCALLYGWGLGLGTSLGISQRVLLGLCVYVLQMLFFSLWMRRFKFGPLEGIWRKLTKFGMKQ